jgi:hypothetical protein
MKRLLRILGLVLLAGLLLLAAGWVWASGAIRRQIETHASRALRVPVTLGGFHINPFTGSVRLEHLRIANPEGFHTDALFTIRMARVALGPGFRAWRGAPLHIRSIELDAPEVTYEADGILNSNIASLLSQFSFGEPPPPGRPDRPAEPAASPGVPMKVDRLRITNAAIRLSMVSARGKTFPLPLDPIEITGIGAGGVQMDSMDVASIFLKALENGVNKALEKHNATTRAAQVSIAGP